MRIAIYLDRTGWLETAHGPVVEKRWESLTTDELTLRLGNIPEGFPKFSDLPEVRRHFRDRAKSLSGGLISCDAVLLNGQQIIKVVYKYSTGRGPTIGAGALLLAHCGNSSVELEIRGTEQGITGVREAVVLTELIRAATPAQMDNFTKGRFPLEWKFERYDPDAQTGMVYFLSDDEKYDERFPHHPLSRVRRWCRWIERTYVVEPEAELKAQNRNARDDGASVGGFWSKLKRSVAPADRLRGLNLTETSGQSDLHLLQPKIAQMPTEELVRHLGPEVAADLGSAQSIPLEIRQQKYKLAINDASRVVLEQSQKASGPRVMVTTSSESENGMRVMSASEQSTYLEDFIHQDPDRKVLSERIVQSVPILLRNVTVESEICWVLQSAAPESWHTIPVGGIGKVLILFSGKAGADDFVGRRKLSCSPVRLTLKNLFEKLPDFLSLGFVALTLDPCGKCTDTKLNLALLTEFPTPESLLKFWMTHLASRKALTRKYFDKSVQQSDLNKRLEMLSNIIVHIDSGAPEVHLEIIRVARVLNRPELIHESTRRIREYAPSFIPDLNQLLIKLIK
jgi:hypothetical protein